MKTMSAIVALCAVVATHANAQTDPAVVQTAQLGSPATQTAIAPAMQQLVLPANTAIAVTPNDHITTMSTREGDTFAISTVADVMHSGYVVIPKNTLGQARITWRTGKGAFGKSGKMEVSFESLEIGKDRTLHLTGKHRQVGKGNIAGAIGAWAAAGIIGAAIVTGKSAAMPHGMVMTARTAEPLTFAIPAGATIVPQVPQATILNNPVTVPTATIVK
ncbi:MAG: hypothetical protein ABI668_02785 [Sphingorhabdus sp.]